MKMVAFIKGHIKMMKNMVMVFAHGQMVKYTQEGGYKENKMAKPHSPVQMDKSELESGKTENFQNG